MRRLRGLRSLQDLYPTPKNTVDFGDHERRRHGFNIASVTALLFIPPCLIGIMLTVYYDTQVESKTDLANTLIFSILLFILAGLFSVVSFMSARSVMRNEVSNLTFLSVVYVFAVLPLAVIGGRFVAASAPFADAWMRYAAAGAAVLVFVFVFTALARLSNAR